MKKLIVWLAIAIALAVAAVGGSLVVRILYRAADPIGPAYQHAPNQGLGQDSAQLVAQAFRHLNWFAAGSNGYPETRWDLYHIARAGELLKAANWPEYKIMRTLRKVLLAELAKAERLARESHQPKRAFEAALGMCALLNDVNCRERLNRLKTVLENRSRFSSVRTIT